MLDALFVTSEWVHSDTYSDDIKPYTTHHYFDSSWDLEQEMIQAAHPHKHPHDHLQQELPLTKGVSSNHGHVPVPHQVDLPVERNGHSSTPVTSTPVPAHEGAANSNSIPETDSHTHPSSQASAL